MTQLEMGMEGLVDKFGLSAVLSALQTVCLKKEAHISENWQDRALARKWGTVRAKLSHMSNLIETIGL